MSDQYITKNISSNYSQTIIEEYPEYGFVPTSVVKKGRTIFLILSLIFLAAATGFYIAGVAMEIDRWYYYNDYYISNGGSYYERINKEEYENLDVNDCYYNNYKNADVKVSQTSPLLSIFLPLMIAACMSIWVFRKSNNKKWLFLCLTIVLLILSVYFVSGSPRYIMYNAVEECGDFWLLMSSVSIIIVAILRKIYRAEIKRAKENADYITKKRLNGSPKKYIIFVKDRKFGVMKRKSYFVAIPAEYDKLTWNDKYTLIAKKAGQRMVIDIYGNKLS